VNENEAAKGTDAEEGFIYYNPVKNIFEVKCQGFELFPEQIYEGLFQARYLA